MEKFRENKLFILLIILLGVMAILSVIIFIFPSSNIEKFEKRLETIDQEFSRQHYLNASREIKKATRYIHEYKLWLKLIQRSYNISKITKDYEIYLYVSQKAVRDLKGNEECWAFYISALFWNGEILKASKYLDRLQSPEYDSLRGEILLVLENRKLTEDDSIKDSNGLIEALGKRRDPILYEKIGLLAKNDYLLFNAALLWMREGQFDRAHNIIMGLASVNPSLFASALISYDSENFADAINLLLTLDSNSYESYMLMGDCYYYSYLKSSNRGQLKESIKYYKRAESLSNNNDMWKIHANLSQFHNTLGEIKKGYQYSLRNIKEYPLNPYVVRHFVENNFGNHPVLSKQSIDFYLKEFPDDTQINLLRIKYFPEDLTLAEMNSFLWNLFNKNPDEEIARFFLWFLLGNQDYQSAEILLSRLENRSKTYKWIPMYHSILLFLQHKYDNSEEIMSTYNNEDPSWFSSYNFSLINLYLKKINRSLDFFIQSEEELKKNRTNMETDKYLFYMATINAYKSIIYNNMGLYEKAEKAKTNAEKWGQSSSHIDSLLF